MTRLASTVLILGVLSAGCGGAKGPLPEKPSQNVGRCVYTNGFSKKLECREYRGAQWTQAEATADCKDQNKGLEVGGTCAEFTSNFGQCVIGKTDKYTWITMMGVDASACASTKRGCEFFGGGIFAPSNLCAAIDPDSSAGGVGLPIFQWPERVCKDPLAGEPAGQGPNGQVCTWEMISAATEEGRSFEDYASCDRVRTQRPYYPAPTQDNAEQDDARLADPAYAARGDLAQDADQRDRVRVLPLDRARRRALRTGTWISPATSSTASTRAGWRWAQGGSTPAASAPSPPSRTTASTAPRRDSPTESIFVTTDQARVKRIFEAELAHRGIKREDFPAQSYGAGPLDDQRLYQATDCDNGEGVAADGTMTWRQGSARYVYVMEATSSPPGVPPNLDMPAGVLWRFDVPWTGAAVASGAGDATASRLRARCSGLRLMGPAPALVSGQKYYLYVLADIAQPNTRCLFTMP